MVRTGAAKVFLGLAVIASVLITLNSATDGDAIPWARAPLLMPWLVLVVIFDRPRPAPRFVAWLLVAQVLSWLGDIALALDDDAVFLVGVGCFLLAQASYIVTFLRIPGAGLIKQRPILLAPYGLYLVAMMAVVLPGAGMLAPALVVYGSLLLAMAIFAMNAWSKVPRRAAWLLLIGSILFVISDSLIAVTKFGPLERTPLVGTVLIGTYCIAQIMLALGVLDAARDVVRRAPVQAPAAA